MNVQAETNVPGQWNYCDPAVVALWRAGWAVSKARR